MSETPDDSIGRLLKQVRELKQILHSGGSLPSDQRRALRLLRITLMSVLTNRVCQLREIANAVKKICTSFDSGIAVFHLTPAPYVI